MTSPKWQTALRKAQVRRGLNRAEMRDLCHIVIGTDHSVDALTDHQASRLATELILHDRDTLLSRIERYVTKETA